MSSQTTIGPEARFNPFDAEPILLTPFQHSMDATLQARVRKIIPIVGRFLLEPVDLNDRTRNHPTSVENNFIHADTDRTKDALQFFRGGVSNLDEATETVNSLVAKHNLHSYSEIHVITPHTSMADILIATYLLHHTDLLDGKDASDITMPLSPLLAHALFKPTGLNMMTGMISPVCNVLPVLPATRSIQGLRDEFHQVADYNNASLEAKNDFKKTKEGKQLIDVYAPSGSRSRMHRLIYNKIQPVPDSSNTMLRRAHREGAAIVVMSCEVNPLGFAPRMPKQKLRHNVSRVILPDEELGKDKAAFKQLVWDSLLTAAKVTNFRPIQ